MPKLCIQKGRHDGHFFLIFHLSHVYSTHEMNPHCWFSFLNLLFVYKCHCWLTTNNLLLKSQGMSRPNQAWLLCLYLALPWNYFISNFVLVFTYIPILKITVKKLLKYSNIKCSKNTHLSVVWSLLCYWNLSLWTWGVTCFFQYKTHNQLAFLRFLPHSPCLQRWGELGILKQKHK